MPEVTGCHHASECRTAGGGRTRWCDPWAVPGQYHIQVAITAVLPRPLPCDGRHKPWALPADVEAAARTQFEAA